MLPKREHLRYADDILVFCIYKWEAEDALKLAKEILEGELNLTLNPEKTQIVHGRKKGIEFLGVSFQWSLEAS